MSRHPRERHNLDVKRTLSLEPNRCTGVSSSIFCFFCRRHFLRAARLPPRLLAHMRRWDRNGISKEHLVEYNGKPVQLVKKAFRKVVQLAEVDTSIENVTPHTLRHTSATWLMQQGVDLWTAAGYLGLTVEVLERVYGHHHPDHLAEAVEGITAKQPKEQALG